MTTSAPTSDFSVTPQTPWLGLHPFTEKARSFFFGRAREVDDLYKRVIDRPLAVLFGQSGLGKSSLLKAGLAPRLRANGWLPVSIRLDHDSNAPRLESQVLDELRNALQSDGYLEQASRLSEARNDGTADPDDGALLWLLFHDPTLGLIPPRGAPAMGFPRVIFVLDQFEEIFTLGERPVRRGYGVTFREALADLVENRPPVSLGARLEADAALAERLDYSAQHARVLLSLREDFLHMLERWRRTMPSLMENRLELRLLNGPQAFQAVVRPGQLRPGMPPIIPDSVGEAIVRFVAGARHETALEEIDAVPPLLSLVCAELNAQRVDLDQAQISPAQVEGQRTNILASFYLRSFDRSTYGSALDGIPNADAALRSLRNLIEDRLLSSYGYRQSVAFDTVTDELSDTADPTTARAALDALVDRRLLTVEERGGVHRVELAHDVLAPIVRHSRDNRHEIEAAARARVAQKRAAARVWRLSLVVGLLAILLAAALREWVVAERQKRNAERQTRLAGSRMLAGAALAFKDNALDLSMLLSAEARGTADTADARNSLAVCLGTNSALLTYLRSDAKAARCVAVSPDGKHIASCGEGGFIHFWDADTYQPFGEILVGGLARKVQTIAFSPDGKWLASGDKSGEIYLYDRANWPPKSTRLARVKEVRGLSFSPDSRMLASAGGDGEVFLWDANPANPSRRALEGQSKRVHSVSFSRDGKLLASGGEGGLVLWEVATGRALAPATQPHQDPDPRGTNYVGAVAFSPVDTNMLASGGPDGRVTLWRIAPALAREPTPDHGESWSAGKRTLEKVHTDAILCLAFSPDGQTLVSSGWDNTINRWDVSKGERLGEPFKGHRGYVIGLAFLAAGTKLASASADSTVIVWDVHPTHRLATDVMIAAPKDMLALAVGRGGDVMAAGGADGTLFLWTEQKSREPMRVALEGHRHNVTGLAFSRDGQRLASVGGDGEAFLWDLTTTTPQRQSLVGHSGDVHAVAFSPDDRMLATGGPDWEVILWDLSARPPRAHMIDSDGRNGHVKLPEQGQEREVMAVVFTPDGRTLVTGGQDKRVTFWDITRATPPPQTLPDEIKGWVQTLAISPDGKTLAAGAWYDDVILWDIATRTRLPRLIGPRTDVASLAFSPDGKTLASGGADATILL